MDEHISCIVCLSAEQEDLMPYTPEEKSRAVTRIRRIRGQAEALERAIQAGASCSALLQQIVAMRGATNGLMAEVMESHLRETFDPRIKSKAAPKATDYDEDLEGVMKILRRYLK